MLERNLRIPLEALAVQYWDSKAKKHMDKTLIHLLVLASLLVGAHAAAAQSTSITYQGRVQSGGTNFTGEGQFKFALLTGTNSHQTATATATISGGFLTIITVATAGNGYVAAPAVSILGGGGSGAVASAAISGGVVTGFTIPQSRLGLQQSPDGCAEPAPAQPDLHHAVEQRRFQRGRRGADQRGEPADRQRALFGDAGRYDAAKYGGTGCVGVHAAWAAAAALVQRRLERLCRLEPVAGLDSRALCGRRQRRKQSSGGLARGAPAGRRGHQRRRQPRSRGDVLRQRRQANRF